MTARRFVLEVDDGAPRILPGADFAYAVHFRNGASDGDHVTGTTHDAIGAAIGAALDNTDVDRVSLTGPSGNLLAIVLPESGGVRIVFHGWRP